MDCKHKLQGLEKLCRLLLSLHEVCPYKDKPDYCENLALYNRVVTKHKDNTRIYE